MPNMYIHDSTWKRREPPTHPPKKKEKPKNPTTTKTNKSFHKTTHAVLCSARPSSPLYYARILSVTVPHTRAHVSAWQCQSQTAPFEPCPSNHLSLLVRGGLALVKVKVKEWRKWGWVGLVTPTFAVSGLHSFVGELVGDYRGSDPPHTSSDPPHTSSVPASSSISPRTFFYVFLFYLACLFQNHLYVPYWMAFAYILSLLN